MAESGSDYSWVGSVANGLFNIVGNYVDAQNARDRYNALKKVASNVKSQVASLKNQVQQHNDEFNYSNESDLTDWQNAVRNTNYADMVNGYYDTDGDGVADFNEFSYDKTVDDFVNENKDKIVGDTMKKAQGTASMAGMGRSFDGANAIVNAAVEKNEELYNDALNAYNTDRAQSLNEWNSYLTQKSNLINQLMTASQNDLTNMKGLADNYINEQNSEFEDLMNVELAGLNAQTTADTAAASNYSNSSLLGLIGF